jgi:Kef-type K+ transport system membrane component KefB
MSLESLTTLGNTAVACAAVDDVTAWRLLAVVIATVEASGFGSAILGSLGIAVKAPNIWWSIQSLGKTTDLTDQKRIFTD